MRRILPNNTRYSLLTLAITLLIASVAYGNVPVEKNITQEFIVNPDDDDFPHQDNPPDTITVVPTKEPTNDDFGLLHATSGGFPSTMWQGTTRQTIAELLQHIDSGFSSHIARSIALKLLLTQAETPESDNAFTPNIFELRIKALTAMGYGDKALEMLDALPRSLHTAGSKWQQAELTLLYGNFESACKLIKNAVATYEENRWQQAMIFCQARTKQQDAAMLGIELLREQNLVPPDFFLQAIEILNGQAKTLHSVPDNFGIFDAALLLETATESALQASLDALPLTALNALIENNKFSKSLQESARKRLSPYREATTTEHASPKVAAPPNLKEKILALWQEANEDTDPHLLHRLYILGKVLRIKLDTGLHRPIILQHIDYMAYFPSPILREKLRKAANAKRLGETVLLALLVAGKKDFSLVADYVLSDVIVALRLTGQHDLARAVAADALNMEGWK